MTRSMSAATSRSPVTPTKRCRSTPMRVPFRLAASRPVRERAVDVRGRVARRRVFGVGARHLIERQRDVAHRLRHRADRVVVGIERHHAGAAGQPARGANRRQRRKRGRIRQRVAGVGAEPERREARRDGGRAAAARAGRAERRIVGVADRAADGADAEVAERKLVEVGLAEHDGAALPHAGGHARIEARPMIDERARAAGGRQPEHVDVVLEDDRDAVKRAAHAAGGALGVARAGVGDRARIEREHRAERRAVAIVERAAASGTRGRCPRRSMSPRVIASCSCGTVFSKTVNGAGGGCAGRVQLTICARWRGVRPRRSGSCTS